MYANQQAKGSLVASLGFLSLLDKFASSHILGKRVSVILSHLHDSFTHENQCYYVSEPQETCFQGFSRVCIGH